MPTYKTIHVVKEDSVFKPDRTVLERAESALNEHIAQGWELDFFKPKQIGVQVFQVIMLLKKQ
ncbi:MAG: hypothetical protein GC165_15730 [Armatimonadetes bacterium]|nr:hypothetical protein [Armatimonadota bacterium]